MKHSFPPEIAESGHDYKRAKSFCSHNIYKYFFTNRVVDVWNNLPYDVISFKCKLNKANFSF